MINTNIWATKYRPRKFIDVKGQPDKVFLFHTLKFGRELPPVLLLCGPSGIGKTTIARIVAASANCDVREIGKDAEPCGSCAACHAIFEGTHPAISEIDAATYSGADDMRAIREQANLSAPGHLQVFIIDEAHSLSGQAWNVLLKLFEEPPANVCFILLTSEPVKVPTKIRTRAMRFDFGKVEPEKIVSKVREVAEAEGVEVPSSVIDSIVDFSDGSVRSAVMMLQQFAMSPESFENLQLRDNSFEIIHAVLRKDRADALRLLHESYIRLGDFKGIMEMWAVAMEQIIFFQNNIPTFVSPAKEKILEEVSNNINELQWAAGMEVLTEWSSKATTKAHIAFVLTAFMRAMFGPTRLTPSTTQEKKKDVADDGEFDALLKELRLG